MTCDGQSGSVSDVCETEAVVVVLGNRSPPGNTSTVTTNFAFLRFLACHIARARGITSQSLKQFLLKIEELLPKYFHCKSSY